MTSPSSGSSAGPGLTVFLSVTLRASSWAHHGTVKYAIPSNALKRKITTATITHTALHSKVQSKHHTLLNPAQRYFSLLAWHRETEMLFVVQPELFTTFLILELRKYKREERLHCLPSRTFGGAVQYQSIGSQHFPYILYCCTWCWGFQSFFLQEDRCMCCPKVQVMLQVPTAPQEAAIRTQQYMPSKLQGLLHTAVTSALWAWLLPWAQLSVIAV